MLYENERKYKLIEKALVKDRLNNRFLKNKCKPPISNNDILQIDKFDFKNTAFSKIGDSGKLLLAVNKFNKNEKYIVKHEYIDCACNEFMYSKLGQLLGVKYADTKFFNTLTPPLNSLFTTEDVVGIEYLDIKNDKVNFGTLKDECKNIEDYFKFLAISKLLLDEDSYEIVLDKKEYIYKIDNTATFCLSNYTLQSIYIDFSANIKGMIIDVEEFTKKQFEKKLEYYKLHNFSDYKDTLVHIRTNYDEKYVKYYLQPFQNLYNLKLSKIDNIINTLCYFYPDYVGDYYKKYIEITQNKVEKFLKEVEQEYKK